MNIAVIFAGGSGTRMNSKDIPKQFLTLYHKPIIIHTLLLFEEHSEIDAIVVSCLSGWEDYLDGLIKKYHISKVKRIVTGGDTGQVSIYKGLKAAEELATGNDVVLIHDGVRPMINSKIISENIKSVKENGSAITTGLVTETLLEIDEASGDIVHVPERKNSRVAKAPQSFWLKDILEAHEKARSEGRKDFIDSCTMMSHYGFNLHLVDGTNRNIKITTQEDYYLMRAMLEAEENTQLYSLDEKKS